MIFIKVLKWLLVVSFIFAGFFLIFDYEDIEFNSAQNTSWGNSRMNTLALSEKGNQQKVKIAVLDSGIDKNHIDLAGKVVKEFNAISSKTKVIDDLGHGTAIAGIITANDNDLGLIGVAPNVELYSVKILDENGNGKVESLIKAVEWSIENNVQIINMSFGITKDDMNLKKVINKALDEEIVIISAAGNNYGGNVDYPAAYEGVISVTAVDQNLKVADFSSKGKIDFSAPGVDIPILVPNNKYSFSEGTSLASAYVTGIVALVLNNERLFKIKDTEKVQPQIYNYLSSWSQTTKEKGKEDDLYGNGFIIIKEKGDTTYE